jgi:hypothetical protein
MRRIVSARSGWVVSLWLLAAVPAVAHDWGKLEVPPPSAAELDAVLGVAEQLQREALADERTPALGYDALAADWLGWLIDAATPDGRADLDRLADRLVEAGVVAADERALALAAWRHDLEHLALTWDARELGVTRSRAEQAAARLADPNLPPEEAVRLSYLVSLGGIDTEPGAPSAPSLARLGALIEAARRAGEAP